jgi:hypothetical protein
MNRQRRKEKVRNQLVEKELILTLLVTHTKQM